MNVPFVDLKRQYFEIRNEADDAIRNVLDKGVFILGDNVSVFEKEFANYCNAKYGIGVASGTEALQVALMACGIGLGDEVITVPNTATPTAMAISLTGATPRFVDVDEKTFNIDPEKIEEAINEKTKAIMPVDLYGQPCEYDRIKEIADKHGLKIIEDACQAHGSEYKGKKTGSHSFITCFSFYPTKNLGCYGDGGMIVTNDEEVQQKCRMIRSYGEIQKYNSQMMGINSRLDEIHAAVLRAELNHLDKWNDSRRKTANIYCNEIKTVKMPFSDKNSKHVFHLFVSVSNNRDKFQEYLKNNGISTLVHYPNPIYLMKAYQSLNQKQCKNAEFLSKHILSLPMFPQITKDEIDYVIETVNKFEGD